MLNSGPGTRGSSAGGMYGGDGSSTGSGDGPGPPEPPDITAGMVNVVASFSVKLVVCDAVSPVELVAKTV